MYPLVVWFFGIHPKTLVVVGPPLPRGRCWNQLFHT